MKTSTRHIGRNVSRLRELRGMKQEALAQAMGVSQQAVSHLENSEEIEESKLKQIAEILGIPVDGIKHFSEETIFNIIGNTVTNYDNGSLFKYAPTYNPFDQLLIMVEENKNLYERLLQAEKDKVAYLEALLSKTH